MCKDFHSRNLFVGNKTVVVALKIHLGSRQLPRAFLRQTVFLQQSPWQKYCQGDYFLAKYIFSLQFLILISRQNYRLQTRDITCTCQRSVCTCYKKSDLLYIFGSLFIPFLFVHVAIEQALLSHYISSYWWNSVTSHV